MRPRRSSNEQAVRAALRLGQRLHFSGDENLRICVSLVSERTTLLPADGNYGLAKLCTLHPRVAKNLIDELGPAVRITCTPLARRRMKRHGGSKTYATR